MWDILNSFLIEKYVVYSLYIYAYIPARKSDTRFFRGLETKGEGQCSKETKYSLNNEMFVPY